MERIFQAAVVVFALAAAYFLWVSNSDWAFATGVLAAASFFLSIRFQMKARNDDRVKEKHDQ
ncbi:MAG TPA: hypothetical protein VGQ55_15790 [Pyrinomonadaceae bacterium]|jgi:hypothetical protein|nr:hypothetical protein [Pyrinomonadaceae bacterium]